MTDASRKKTKYKKDEAEQDCGWLNKFRESVHCSNKYS